MKIIKYTSLIALVALCFPVLPIRSETNNPNNRIAFVMLESEANNLCVIEVDDSNQSCFGQIAHSISQAHVWSPDGSTILYQQPYVSGEPGSHIVDIASGLSTAVHVPLAFARVVGWSPDGSQFLIVGKTASDADSDIYTMRSDNRDLKLLTNNELSDELPIWSPGGNYIAYLSGYPEAALMVMRADGSDPVQLTEGLLVNREVQPQWAPEGWRIAFAAREKTAEDARISEIYTIQRDGYFEHRLTWTDAVNLDPRWSPDGSQLVFYGYELDAFDDVSSTTSLRTEVFRVNADGTDLVNLTQSIGLDYHPAWSPDGEWIAFASIRGSPGIFIMRPDGTDVRMVTNEPPFSEGGREAHRPVWKPLPMLK